MLLICVIAFSVLCFACSGIFLSMTKQDTGWFRFLERLPREKWSGSILSTCVIFWCVPNLRPILSPDSVFQNVLIPMAVISSVLVILFLDYLFARAIGALMILIPHFLLMELYPGDPVWFYSVFALLLMALSIIGMCIAAKPHWLRDLFRVSFRTAWVRIIFSVYFLFLGGFALSNLPRLF